MPTFTSDWFSNNIPNWKMWLREYIGRPNLSALEVGCWEGRSSLWLMENILTADSDRLTCVDLFIKGHEFDNNLAPHMDRIKKCMGTSQEQLPKLLAEHNKYDIVYIDGSHLVADMVSDGVFALPMVKIGGTLIFDDYHFDPVDNDLCTPQEALNAYAKVFTKQLRQLPYIDGGSDWQLALRKVAEV